MQKCVITLLVDVHKCKIVDFPLIREGFWFSVYIYRCWSGLITIS